MRSNIVVAVEARNTDGFAHKVDAIEKIAAGDAPVPVPPIVDPPVDPPPVDPVPKRPWFEIGGGGEGRPGSTVGVTVYGGCLEPVSGFHIGGGCGLVVDAAGNVVVGSGYDMLKPVGVTLGAYLYEYLEGQGMIVDDEELYFRKFQHVTQENRALPEEWWEFAAAWFALSQGKFAPPIAIPSGTALFTVEFQIPLSAESGELRLTCADEHYYTHWVQRRRDFLYTNNEQGLTNVECLSGDFKVI